MCDVQAPIPGTFDEYSCIIEGPYKFLRQTRRARKGGGEDYGLLPVALVPEWLIVILVINVVEMIVVMVIALVVMVPVITESSVFGAGD